MSAEGILCVVTCYSTALLLFDRVSSNYWRKKYSLSYYLITVRTISDKPHENIKGYTLLQMFLMVLYQFQLCKASGISYY